MSKINGSVWKTSHRLSFSILETGEELQKHAYAPGQHRPTKRIKLTNYGQQLRGKQKTRYMYGLNERQLYNTFIEASRMRGVTGGNSLDLPESRLDNLVYRMGLAHTCHAAHRLVNHGHILANGKKVDIPSFTVEPGMVAKIKEKSRDMKAINEALEATLNTVAPVDIDRDVKKGTYLRLSGRNKLNSEFNELLVIELYDG